MLSVHFVCLFVCLFNAALATYYILKSVKNIINKKSLPKLKKRKKYSLKCQHRY